MLKDKLRFLTLEVLKITMEAEGTSAKKKRLGEVKTAAQATGTSSDDDMDIDGSDVESERSVVVVSRSMRS